MKDVAKDAGVSIFTVSSTLSGAAHVSAELRARVRESVERLGYEPNTMASNLKRGRSSLVGLIVSDVTNPFFTELVECIQNDARQAGLSVILGVTGYDVRRESELLRLMSSHQVAGTILTPAGSEEDYSDGRLRIGRMKVVAVDNAPPSLGVDAFALDNRLAAKLAVSHLLDLGHRRIGVVSGVPHQYVTRERLAGHQDALMQAGIRPRRGLISHGDFRLEDAYRCCSQLLQMKPRPSALFLANNLMLIGAMRALADHGVSVPDEMSVCSIDDFPWAPAFQPGLTVVRQPILEMASAAFQCLINRLSGNDGELEQRVFAPSLVVRGSCAAYPA